MPSDSTVASDVRTDLARWRPRRQQRSEVFVPAAGSSQPGRSAGILRSHPRRFRAAYCGCFMRSFAPLFVPSLFAPFSMMTRL
jgi:hypothetical protein